jgi:hypothetical protein
MDARSVLQHAAVCFTAGVLNCFVEHQLPMHSVCNTYVAACRDLKADLVYSSQADVMIGVHGEGLFNAFFMPQHSSLIEIRPLNFTGLHPNQYMKVGMRHDASVLLVAFC